MDRRRTLVALSAVQLLTDLVGLAIATRRRQPGDLIGLHITLPRDHILRDSVVLGSAQSAPLVMVVAQAWATVTLASGRNLLALRTLRVLGAAMVAGCLVERGSPLWPGHLDALSTPVFAASLGGAVAMAVLASPPQSAWRTPAVACSTGDGPASSDPLAAPA